MISSTGAKFQENGGRLVNAIPETLADGARNRVVIKRAPGLNLVADAQRANCRGMLAVGGQTLVAFTNRLVVMQPSGTGPFAVTDLGAFDGDVPVTMAKNNKTPNPDIVAVSENGGFILSTSGPPVSYTDPDLGSPNSVCFGDGYFFFTYGDGTVIASGLNTTDVDPVDYATAEAKSDVLLRGVFFRQELFLMGSASIEVWQNTANETGFPFSRSTVIPRGLIGQWAVAGWEDGWANTLIWVGDDKIVYRMNGYSPERISTFDIERAIEAVAAAGNASTIKASVFMADGHAYWAVKSDQWTWVYDLTMGSLHERESYQRQTWRAQFSVTNYGIWLVGDDTTGAVYKVQGNYYREGNTAFVWEVTSGQMADFPLGVSCPRTDFDFVVAVGDDTGEAPVQTAPVVEISWSDDGGVVFNGRLLRSLGGMGKYGSRVTVLRTGLTGPQGRQWQLRVSDPVYVGLIGGDMVSDVRAR